MDVDRGVDQVRIVVVAVGDRVGFPFVESLLEKPSTRQVTATGMLSSARSRTSGYIILGGRRGRSRPSLAAGSRSPARVAWCACGVLGSRLPDRRPAAGVVEVAGREAVFSVGDPQPPSETRLGDPEVLGDLGDRLIALAGDRDDVAPELLRKRLGHDDDPSSEDRALTGQESTEPWGSPQHRVPT